MLLDLRCSAGSFHAEAPARSIAAGMRCMALLGMSEHNSLCGLYHFICRCGGVI